MKERQQALESEQARIYKIAGFVLVGLIFAWRFIEEKTELITLLAPAEIKERFGSMRVVNQMDLIPLWQCALVCAGLIVLIVLTKYIADKNQLRTKPPFYIDHSDPKAIRVYGDLTGENSSLAVKEVLGRMPYYRPLMTPEVPGRYGCELVLLLEDDPYLYR